MLFRRLVIVNKIVDSEHHQQQEIGDRAGNQCVDQDVKQRCERDEPDFRGAGKLFETADIVIDNCCVNKDACLTIDGQRRCPLSSVTVLLCGVLLLEQLHELSAE